jgi:hypothetical protein
MAPKGKTIETVKDQWISGCSVNKSTALVWDVDNT